MRIWASDSFRSTPCTRPCANAITPSKRRVSDRSPTTTSSHSKSGPTVRSRPPTRSAWGEAAEGPHEHLHQLRGRDRNRNFGSGGSQAGDSQRESQSLGRRVGAFGAQLQLPEEREYPDHRRTGAEDRSRNAEDKEFWPQVAERNQRDSVVDGTESGHEDRRARQRRAWPD